MFVWMWSANPRLSRHCASAPKVILVCVKDAIVVCVFVLAVESSRFGMRPRFILCLLLLEYAVFIGVCRSAVNGIAVLSTTPTDSPLKQAGFIQPSLTQQDQAASLLATKVIVGVLG